VLSFLQTAKGIAHEHGNGSARCAGRSTSPSGRPEKLRLGDVLVQQKLISQEQLQQTLDLQRTTGKKVGAC